MSEHKISTDALVGENDSHSWLSNPLDWRYVDRMIALSFIAQLISVIFGGTVLFALNAQQNSVEALQYLNPTAASYLLTLFALHIILNLGFTLVAFKKREHQSNWPLHSYVIGFSFVTLALCMGYATGSYFSDGIVLLLFALALALPLMDLDILKRAYIFAWIGFMVLIVIDFGELLPFAPLFSNNLTEAQRPILGWHLLRVITSFAIYFTVFFFTLPTTRRWRDRESLYMEMSSTDGLTRLTNRRSFIERSNAEFSKLQRMPGKLACIMIDLDYFKHINDTYGHQAGDAVLVEVAQILSDNAREYDEVGRYGGEEFAVLLPNTSKDNAAMIAERIRKQIEETAIDIGDRELSVTASLGVAAYPIEGVTGINDLLKFADQALYIAKEKSRNTVVVYEQDSGGEN